MFSVYVFWISSPVLRMPVCTRVQDQSANPALWFTRLLFVELMDIPTPPRYPITSSFTDNRDIWATFPLDERHTHARPDFTSSSSSVSSLLSLSLSLSVSWTTRHASRERRSPWSVLACVLAPLSPNRALQRRKVHSSAHMTAHCKLGHFAEEIVNSP